MLNTILNTKPFDTLFSNLNTGPAKFEHDVLAVSCCKQRIDLLPDTVSGGIRSLPYTKNLESCDVELSKAIRSYYGQKLIVATLLGEELSPFRQALAAFLNKDGKTVQEDELGIACKLPEFYAYDLARDQLVKDASTLTEKTTAFAGKKTLTPVTRLVRRMKDSHKIDYWLKDESNNLCLIKIQPKNPLDHIFKRMFDTSPNLRIDAHYLPKVKGKLTYFDVSKWDLLLD